MLDIESLSQKYAERLADETNAALSGKPGFEPITAEDIRAKHRRFSADLGKTPGSGMVGLLKFLARLLGRLIRAFYKYGEPERAEQANKNANEADAVGAANAIGSAAIEAEFQNGALRLVDVFTGHYRDRIGDETDEYIAQLKKIVDAGEPTDPGMIRNYLFASTKLVEKIESELGEPGAIEILAKLEQDAGFYEVVEHARAVERARAAAAEKKLSGLQPGKFGPVATENAVLAVLEQPDLEKIASLAELRAVLAANQAARERAKW